MKAGQQSIRTNLPREVPLPTDPKREFLKTEYDKCLDLLKHYDTRHNDLTKFASGLSAAVPSIIFGFHALSPAASASVWDFTAVVALLTGVSILTIFAALIQNRLYFVYPARQVNAIRSVFFSQKDSLTNHMYKSVDFPVFKLSSSQTFLYGFVALQASFFFGVATYGLFHNLEASGMVVFIIFILAFGFAADYLIDKNDKDADQAVHGVPPAAGRSRRKRSR